MLAVALYLERNQNPHSMTKLADVVRFGFCTVFVIIMLDDFSLHIVFLKLL